MNWNSGNHRPNGIVPGQLYQTAHDQVTRIPINFSSKLSKRQPSRLCRESAKDLSRFRDKIRALGTNLQITDASKQSDHVYGTNPPDRKIRRRRVCG